MCSFRVKQFQEADSVYYVSCVYRCPVMPSDIEQTSIINDFAHGMYDVYILLMRHHYDHVMLYLSVYICSHPVFSSTEGSFWSDMIQICIQTTQRKATNLLFFHIYSPSSGSQWYVKKVVPAMEG